MSAHAPTASAAPPDRWKWDDLPLVDRVAAQIYNTKAQSPQEMTAERWMRIKARFRASARLCLEEAQQMIDDGEFD